jgi:hypothetical protein
MACNSGTVLVWAPPTDERYIPNIHCLNQKEPIKQITGANI